MNLHDVMKTRGIVGATGADGASVAMLKSEEHTITGVTGAPFVPSDLAGLNAWYKADSLSLSDGATVATWTDSGSNGYNATQATEDYKPTFETNELGGKPVVRFSGTDKRLNIAGNPLLASAIAGFTVICLQYERVLDHATFSLVGDSQEFLGYAQASTYYWTFRGGGGGCGTFSPNGNPTNTWKLVSVKSASSTAAARVWGAAQSISGYSHGGSGNSSGLGSPDSGGGNDVDIAELLVFTGALSNSDIEKVEGYLAHKYSLTASLPGGHPYKTNPPLGPDTPTTTYNLTSTFNSDSPVLPFLGSTLLRPDQFTRDTGTNEITLLVEPTIGQTLQVLVSDVSSRTTIEEFVAGAAQTEYVVATPFTTLTRIRVWRDGIELREDTSWTRDTGTNTITIPSAAEGNWIKVEVG